MKSNKYVYLFVIFFTLLLHTRMASAIDIGLDTIPLESITIEPEIGYYNNRRDNKEKFTGEKSDDTYGGTEILAGVYLRKAFGKGIEGYYGGRVDIGQYQDSSSYADGDKRDSTTNSMFLTPTLGLQYFFNKQFSMGVDAGLRIEESTNKYEYTNSRGVVARKDETNGFRTTFESHIVVRALF